jgi:DNA-binding beta-propeller fold protein YncE
MKKILVVFLALSAGTLAIRFATSQHAIQQKVGPLPDGGFLLNSGWTIRPAGQQVEVGTFPMSSVLSRNGKYLLVLNAGYDPPTISVIDVASKNELSKTHVADAWLGLRVDPRSDIFYVGGGTTGKVFEFALDPDTGAVTAKREIPAVEDLANKSTALIGDVELSRDGHYLYAGNLYGNEIAVLDVREGKYLGSWKTGRRPYRIMVAPNGHELLVTAWGDGLIYVHDSKDGKVVTKIRAGAHPTDMLWINHPPAAEEGQSNGFTGRVFVTAANTNNTYSFGVTADGQLSALETLNVSTSPMHPLGMTPSALATDETGTKLFVVCSDANAVAQVDISAARSRVEGFIPTGWYPTAITTLKNGELAILNGKGLGSHPNATNGPNPMKSAAQIHAQGSGPVEYVGHIQKGTAQFMPMPDDEKINSFTQTVIDNSPYRDELLDQPITDEQTAYFAKRDGHLSPIQHVIYIIKENRTYDQVLGDMSQGNGDKSLVLFGEEITPNLHQLAHDYILYDNFYENADVSADGHNWASAAIAPDYVTKIWPSEYGHRSKLYNFEGGEPANTPPAGYIWDNALQAGLTIRDYGQWVTNIPLKEVTGPKQVAAVKDPALVPYVDMNYRSFDLEYADVDRAKEFIREWKEFDAASKVPQMSILRMGNDHTQGTTAGKLTPLSYNADNDYAVGMLVDAVSHSNAWSSTAIFIIEDDAQNGPDHVDSHRAPVWVISPFTRRGITDSTMYNQTSILRTMELALGLRPMTHFDAGARPMFGSFSQSPNTQPYSVISPKIPLTDRNPGHTASAAESARMDFSDADRADDDALNDVLWRAIKHTEPPVPTRSAFGQ